LASYSEVSLQKLKLVTPMMCLYKVKLIMSTLLCYMPSIGDKTLL